VKYNVKIKVKNGEKHRYKYRPLYIKDAPFNTCSTACFMRNIYLTSGEEYQNKQDILK